MFTTAVLSSVFFPADWDYEYCAVRSFFGVFQLTSSSSELLNHPAKIMPVLTTFQIDMNQAFSFVPRQRARAKCKERCFFPCKLQSLLSCSQPRLAPIAKEKAGIRRLV